MATRYGWSKSQLLIKKGWTVKTEKANEDGEFRCGDPILVDPVTGGEYTPYEAEKIQLQRESQNDADC